MKRLITLVLMIIFTDSSAVEVAGINFQNEIVVDGTRLELNGAGVRKKFGIVSVYVAALYSVHPTKVAEALIHGKEPRRILLTMKREVDPESMLDALHEALGDNISIAEAAAIKPQIMTLDTMFRHIKVREHDTIAIDIDADGNVKLSHNDQFKDRLVGPVVGPALLRIWLGKKPVQQSLKEELLGQ